MFKCLVIFLLNCMLCLEAFEEIEQHPAEHSYLETVRSEIREYALLTAQEQREFLQERGMTKEEFDHAEKYFNLNWKVGGEHKLPESHSILALPEGYMLLTGEDIEALDVLNGEPAARSKEAQLSSIAGAQGTVILRYIETGYVSLSDWDELDPKELLDSITKNTEKDNLERRRLGSDAVYVLGWIQEPTLNRETQTVYWALEGTVEGEESFVNSVAIRLGRKGYEEIIWVTAKSNYVPSGGELSRMLEAHRFESGYRYDEYEIGDKVAAFGVAGLVTASIAGSKLIKAGGLLALLKKIFGFAIPVIAGLFYKLKGFLFRKKDL